MFSSHSYEMTTELDKFTNTKNNTLKYKSAMFLN